MRRGAAAVLLLVTVWAGCLSGVSKDCGPGSCEIALEADGSSEQHEAEWQNDRSRATLRWDLSQAEGRVTVTLLDDAGEEVLANTFEGGSTGSGIESEPGASGTWILVVDLDDVTGPLKVRARSA